MNSGQDLMLALDKCMSSLDDALRELASRGRAAAEAERKYRVALAQSMVWERSRGTPVTLIGDICHGNDEIAKLAFDRDAAKVLYDSAKEACGVYKLQIKILDNQIEREFRG